MQKNNDMMSKLLPMLLNNNNQGGNSNPMLSTLMPMLLNRNGNNSDYMSALAPMMESQNPQMAQVLRTLNSQKTSPAAPESGQQRPQPSASPGQKSRPENKYIDYAKLYPYNSAKLNVDIDNMSRVDDHHAADKSDNFDTFNTDAPRPDNAQSTGGNNNNNNNSTNNNMMAMMQMLQAMRDNRNSTAASPPPQPDKPANYEPDLAAIDKFAPPKIKKSLRAILELNNIIKD